MDIFVYSDESGTFDPIHNDYFVFGGLVCIGIDERDKFSRMYSHVEGLISKKWKSNKEVKGSTCSNAEKASLFRSLNAANKFTIIINQKDLSQDILKDKRHKQRFLDFAYKLVVKYCIKRLIDIGYFKTDVVDEMHIYCDEHTTATNSIYELRESFYNEFKIGTFNYDWNRFYEPIMPALKDVRVHFCNSKKHLLVRAADIIANRIYHLSLENELGFATLNNFTVLYYPLDAK